MGRHCKLCSSPNRTEYEKLYLEGWSVKDVWKYAKTKKDENIPYHTFLYHMKNHLAAVINSGIESSKLRREKIKDEVYKTIEITENLRKNILKVQEMIDTLMKDVDKDTDMKLLLSLLQEARQLYKLLLDYSDKINIKPSLDKDSMYDCFIHMLIEAKVPDKCLQVIEELWEKYEMEF